MALGDNSWCHPRDPSPPQERGPIHKIPVEILLRIFRLLAPPRTIEGVYIRSKLTHVCQFWRVALINSPSAWAAISIAPGDRRSFVEMCLERSFPAPLDITMDVDERGKHRPSCACDRDQRNRLLPNETDPCEWHFVFEILAKARHSGRIQDLNVSFYGAPSGLSDGCEELALGSCRFFTLPLTQLTSLGWDNWGASYANHLFSTPPFPPTLRSLSFRGAWHGRLTRVNNLTALVLDHQTDRINVEVLRTFMMNNQSLETLSLERINLEGSSGKPPVDLPNLKSFDVEFPPKGFSTVVRVPALQRLSSLYITCMEDRRYTFRATGEEITFSVKCDLLGMTEAWEDLTQHARPTIRHIRLHDHPEGFEINPPNGGTVISLFADAHTLEIGNIYTSCFYNGFMDDLKQLGPQLKTIRFELIQETEPFRESNVYDDWDGRVLDDIEDLVKDRFEHGRPFSAVERMVVSGSARTNRLQDYVWRCFYSRLERYIRPE